VPGRSIYVHLPHGLDPDSWEARYARGTAPDASPYGFHRARELGYRITFSKDRDGPVENAWRVLTMRLCLSIDIWHAFRNRRAMREADAIWTILDSEGLAVAALMRAGVVARKPLVGNIVWLFDRWKRFGRLRRSTYRSLVGAFKVLTVHSAGCLPVARAAFPDVRVELVYFGVNVDRLSPRPRDADIDEDPLRIVALGYDPTRDWRTFLEAFGNDPRFAVTLVARHVRASEVAAYSNVALLHNPRHDALPPLYADATYVVVPMRPNIYSGITVALEAVASGTAVICTRTGGVPTYFTDDEVCFVPDADATAMRDAALALSADARRRLVERAQRRFEATDYSTRGMMARYVALTEAP